MIFHHLVFVAGYPEIYTVLLLNTMIERTSKKLVAEFCTILMLFYVFTVITYGEDGSQSLLGKIPKLPLKLGFVNVEYLKTSPDSGHCVAS